MTVNGEMTADEGNAAPRERFELDDALKEEIRAKVLGDGFMKMQIVRIEF